MFMQMGNENGNKDYFGELNKKTEQKIIFSMKITLKPDDQRRYASCKANTYVLV